MTSPRWRGCLAALAFLLAEAPAASQTAPTAAPSPVPAAPTAGVATIGIGYIRFERPSLALSRFRYIPKDDGVAGARLALEDNNTTGRFLKQEFRLEEASVADSAGLDAAFASLADKGLAFVVADLPWDLLLRASELAEAKGITLFNVAATDDILRGAQCRSNVVHVAPSRAMLADALAQFLVVSRWPRWLLIVGSHPADRLYAEAVRRAARRFGGQIVGELVFPDTGGARRTDSGHTQVAEQMRLFTKDAADHDVVVVADESEVFGAYVPFRTFAPRPVAGTAGLVPTAWSPAHEQWGALQIQNRFEALAKRTMTVTDANAWTAVRMVGEAAQRVPGAESGAMRDYLRSDKFSVAAFKGQKLTIRPWDRQLRQPVLLSDNLTVVSVAPEPGFLHQFSELDTLGHDQPETQCRLQ